MTDRDQTRCDGTQPGCKTCEVYQDVCRYEKPPPMTQILAMAKRLQEAEEVIANYNRQGSSAVSSSPDAGPSGHSPSHGLASSSIPKQPSENSDSNVLHTDNEGTYTSAEPTVKETNSETLISDLSLDENGKASPCSSRTPSPRPLSDKRIQLCYYGPTSAVHDPPRIEAQRAINMQYDSQSSKVEVRTMLASNALESRAWEEFALGNAAFQSDIPRATMSKLLQIHWAWIAPMFMWVYRPAFMRQYYEVLMTRQCLNSQTDQVICQLEGNTFRDSSW
jgi:hypothetical protein